MNDQAPNPYHLARAEIDGWRGRCLDLFARGEAAISKTLEAAVQAKRTNKIGHLAGQRTSAVLALAEAEDLPAKLRAGLSHAIASWQKKETSRTFLAHGTATELCDRKGQWSVRFDMTIYRSNHPEPEKLVLNREEAETFEAELGACLKSLSSLLGQFRKALKDKPL